MKTLNNPELVKFLKSLKLDKATTESAHAEACNAPLEKMIAHASMDQGDENVKKRIKVRNDLYRAAAAGTNFQYPADFESQNGVAGELVNAAAEVQQFQLTVINNFVRPQLTALTSGLFEVRTLAANERPQFENNTAQGVLVSEIGEDGSPRKGNIVKANEFTSYGLKTLSTEEVVYKLRDILRGSVAEEMKALVDLAGDLALQLDSILWTGVNSTAILAAFDFTNAKKERRTLNLHPTFATNMIANMPTTNLITGLTGEGGPTKAVLVKFLQHFARFGGAIGDVQPTTIHYPSGYDLKALEDVGVTTATGTLSEQVIKRGFVYNLLERPVVLQPVVTMSKALKRVVCATNKPVGVLYLKPSEDETFEVNDRRNNKGMMSAKMVYNVVYPEQYRVHVAGAAVEAP